MNTVTYVANLCEFTLLSTIVKSQDVMIKFLYIHNTSTVINKTLNFNPV